jgi:hypothetical protein
MGLCNWDVQELNLKLETINVACEVRFCFEYGITEHTLQLSIYLTIVMPDVSLPCLFHEFVCLMPRCRKYTGSFTL